jgi:hypothetical protein
VTDELGECGLARGEQGGGQKVAPRGELVAVGLGDLLDDTVGAEQAKRTRDLRGEAADVDSYRRVCRRVEDAA